MISEALTVTKSTSVSISAFFTRVYAWMFAGLLITASVAFAVNINEPLLIYIATSGLLLPVFILEVLVVIAISAQINRISQAVAIVLFLFYAWLNGLFFGVFTAMYDVGTVFAAFFVTAGVFGGLTIYGYTTKQDLSRWGTIAIMSLFGLIIASIVNIFVASTALDWILTYVGLGVFIVLTAWDMQKLKQMYQQNSDPKLLGKIAIIGALELYLDFINLFIRILSIMGRRD